MNVQAGGGQARISGSRSLAGRGATETAAFHLWKWREFERTTLGPERGELCRQDEARGKLWGKVVARLVLTCKSIVRSG
ncbi:hypothetical protein JTE90_009247 [Oedothorax gibbosus]|uniref:Uncharacterized protein n=1 Tax=Oedothorax gibbosus TaxID=931172 RepID=A0AAV6TGV9_9ARAC|nr:hypothetical protein JTE90_009247 [Oedothorax gibbosus]